MHSYTTKTPTVPIVRYDPRKIGLERFFGPTEAMVMAAMWEDGRTSATVKRIHRDLRDYHGHDVAYTTVMTTMTRLYEKGVLQRMRSGLSYTYATRCTQAEYEGIQILAVIRSLESADVEYLKAHGGIK